MKLKLIFKKWRVIFLVVALAIMLFALRPNPYAEGVAINSVLRDSAAHMAGIQSPKAGTMPMNKEIITSINNVPIRNMEDYGAVIAPLQIGDDVQIRTNKGIYRLEVQEDIVEITTNKTEEVNITETVLVNKTIDGNITQVEENVTRTEERPITITESRGVEDIGLGVSNAPTSNLRKGLDLQGGTRVLLKPAEPVDDDTLNLIIDSLTERLNVYGISDVTVLLVKTSPDIIGGGESYILVEIAGVTEQEVKDLIGSQGKFEAKVANQTVFRGGGQDITYVCRTGTCSGIDPNVGCQGQPGNYQCGFYFTITLSQAAAQRQADATANLDVEVSEGGSRQLSEPLVLYLDDQEVDRLNIAADLKGRAVTDISISGAGAAPNEADAARDALKNMKTLQTILITGSLPVKLNIARIDTVSPQLGAQFVNNALLLGVLAILVVISVLVISYRRLILAFPIATIALSEVILILGMASIIGWNIDLAAIAGIIVAIGTGVDDQIVIADETLRGARNEAQYQWKDKLKRAFFIIFTAYFTTMVAMTPLLFAGAGLLKGFALTTMLGVTIGVLITRPAFAALVEVLIKE
ncbi:hypothetical protein GF342_05575 [Candidatus Woesearchaeota archaeon]|nr:hypothetical protein [Candidatus Woesearchaeota archaeon]